MVRFGKAVLLSVAVGAIALGSAQAADAPKMQEKMHDMKAGAMGHSDIAPKIDQQNQIWLAAYGRGDAAALANLYTDNATVLPAGADMVSGHDAIQAFWAATIKNGLKILSLKTVSIDHNGSNAREIGRVVAEVPGADGKPATKLDGKYVVNWKEVKGVWKLDTDIRNMNK